jgi:hypothetical protein
MSGKGEFQMKKLIIMCMVIALAFSGCAFLQKAETVLCTPPAQVVAVVQAAAPVVAMILNMAVPGSAVWVNAANAAATIRSIREGGCVGITQLNALIALLQSDTAKTVQAKAPLNIQPLLDWAKKGK